MSDFIAPADQARLVQYQLSDFEALWQVPLEYVDEPNYGRGGYSQVGRLQLGERLYYLKRQSNYLSRSVRHPWGEPTIAREFRTLRQFQNWGIPVVPVAYFGQRTVSGVQQAILLTPALDGWQDLAHWLAQWPEQSPTVQQAIVTAVGQLARQLHQHHWTHGCFYPKHIFLRPQDGRWVSCLIDLEKARRPLWWSTTQQIRDLEPLWRRVEAWTEPDRQQFLRAYGGSDVPLDAWISALNRRTQYKKESRL